MQQLVPARKHVGGYYSSDVWQCSLLISPSPSSASSFFTVALQQCDHTCLNVGAHFQQTKSMKRVLARCVSSNTGFPSICELSFGKILLFCRPCKKNPYFESEHLNINSFAAFIQHNTGRGLHGFLWRLELKVLGRLLGLHVRQIAKQSQLGRQRMHVMR